MLAIFTVSVQQRKLVFLGNVPNMVEAKAFMQDTQADDARQWLTIGVNPDSGEVAVVGLFDTQGNTYLTLTSDAELARGAC